MIWLSMEFINFEWRGINLVTINGKIEKISAISLLDYLEKNKYRIDRIVVEYNGEIIKKDKFSKIMIQDKDSIEIVSLVGGG